MPDIRPRRGTEARQYRATVSSAPGQGKVAPSPVPIPEVRKELSGLVGERTSESKGTLESQAWYGAFLAHHASRASRRPWAARARCSGNRCRAAIPEPARRRTDTCRDKHQTW